MAIRGRSRPFRPTRSLAYQWYVSVTVATADIATPGTGQAFTPGVEVIARAGIALGSGGTLDPSTQIVANTPTTSGSGGALTPSTLLVANTDLIIASGVAFNPDVFGTNGVAHPGIATGIGSALNPSVQIITPDGSGGDGFPWVIANAGIALGSGVALDPINPNHTIADAGIALGSGLALTPAASLLMSVSTALGSGQIFDPTILTVARAGVALGAGLALDPTTMVLVFVDVATGVGHAFNPVVFVVIAPPATPMAQPLCVLIMNSGLNEAVLADSGIRLIQVDPG